MDKRCYSQSRERTEDERSFDDEHERAVRYSPHAASERRTGPLRYRHPGPHLVTHTKEILTMMVSRLAGYYCLEKKDAIQNEAEPTA